MAIMRRKYIKRKQTNIEAIEQKQNMKLLLFFLIHANVKYMKFIEIQKSKFNAEKKNIFQKINE